MSAVESRKDLPGQLTFRGRGFPRVAVARPKLGCRAWRATWRRHKFTVHAVSRGRAVFLCYSVLESWGNSPGFTEIQCRRDREADGLTDESIQEA